MLDITTEPTRDEMTDHTEPGLPRMVCETHAHLGPQATPQQVCDAIKAKGVETTVEDVKACWPEGGKQGG
ncbi:MAG TPA: hypothetical protein VD866_30410 [Urbifossiella sp.]|nr:hypothetical protein [Urbifossiella sp.]